MLISLYACISDSLSFVLWLQQEGTLMGTAFGVCFGYWIGGSALFYSVSFMCNTHLTFLQILSLSVSMIKAIKIQSICSFVCPKSSLALPLLLPATQGICVFVYSFFVRFFLNVDIFIASTAKTFSTDFNFGSLKIPIETIFRLLIFIQSNLHVWPLHEWPLLI